LIKFGFKPYRLTKLKEIDPNILDAVRSGDLEALKILTPYLKLLIKNKLYYHGLNTREIRDSIFTDIFLDLKKKEHTIILKEGPMEYLGGMVEFLIKRYVEHSKLVLLDNDIMGQFPDTGNMEEPEHLSILWLKLQPFLLKLPRKSRDLLFRIHDGQSMEQICQESDLKDERTLYTRKSQSISKLKKILEASSGNEWLKKKLK